MIKIHKILFFLALFALNCLFGLEKNYSPINGDLYGFNDFSSNLSSFNPNNERDYDYHSIDQSQPYENIGANNALDSSLNDNFIGQQAYKINHNFYINAVLQCLSQLNPLTNEISKMFGICEYLPVQIAYGRILGDFLENPKVTPAIINQFSEHFRENKDHNAHKFLNFFLNNLSDDCKYKFNITSGFNCNKCNKFSTLGKSSNSISLKINDQDEECNLNDLLENYFNVGNNDYFCGDCNTNGVIQEKKLLSLPHLLAINIERFDWFDYKIMTPLKIPLTIKFKPENLKVCKPNHLYNLKSVVYHTGSSLNGHYLANVLDKDSNNLINQNDDQKQACILFYELEDIYDSLSIDKKTVEELVNNCNSEEHIVQNKIQILPLNKSEIAKNYSDEISKNSKLILESFLNDTSNLNTVKNDSYKKTILSECCQLYLINTISEINNQQILDVLETDDYSKIFDKNFELLFTNIKSKDNDAKLVEIKSFLESSINDLANSTKKVSATEMPAVAISSDNDVDIIDLTEKNVSPNKRPREKTAEDEISESNKRQKTPVLNDFISTKGFENKFNNCYLNSVLQCLSQITPLTDIILNKEINDTDNLTIQDNFKKLLLDLKNPDIKCIDPTIFYNKVIQKYFNNNSKRHEDAQEFLNHFVNDLNNDCKDIFDITNVSNVQCTNCKNNSASQESLHSISVSITHEKTGCNLNDLLDEYFKADSIGYKCGTCKTEIGATKKASLLKLPRILTIHIKRFDNNSKKIMTPLDYPESLNLNKYSYLGQPAHRYNLKGVVYHHGNSGKSGHYTARIKNSHDNNWYYCDDKTVSKDSNNDNKQAYILFYELENLEDAQVIPANNLESSNKFNNVPDKEISDKSSSSDSSASSMSLEELYSDKDENNPDSQNFDIEESSPTSEPIDTNETSINTQEPLTSNLQPQPSLSENLPVEPIDVLNNNPEVNVSIELDKIIEPEKTLENAMMIDSDDIESCCSLSLPPLTPEPPQEDLLPENGMQDVQEVADDNNNNIDCEEPINNKIQSSINIEDLLEAVKAANAAEEKNNSIQGFDEDNDQDFGGRNEPSTRNSQIDNNLETDSNNDDTESDSDLTESDIDDSSDYETPNKKQRTDETEDISQSNSKNHACTYCEKSFPKKSWLETHIRSHTGEKPFECTIGDCKTKFGKKSDLNRHMNNKNIHPDIDSVSDKSKHNAANAKKHVCEYCTKEFTKPSELQRHIRSHTDERPYECDCGKKFRCVSTLNEHKKIHTDEKSFPCIIGDCKLAFLRKGDLKAHIRTHTGEKPFECTIRNCKMKFGTKKDLNRHMNNKNIHPDIDSVSDKSKPNAANAKQLVCEYRTKEFTKSSYLKKHIRKHTDERPFECDCGKKFRCISTLNKHKKIHIDERPYECTIGDCNKAFKRKSDLTVHMNNKNIHPDIGFVSDKSSHDDQDFSRESSTFDIESNNNLENGSNNNNDIEYAKSDNYYEKPISKIKRSRNISTKRKNSKKNEENSDESWNPNSSDNDSDDNY